MDKIKNAIVQNIIFVFKKVGYQLLCVCVGGGLLHYLSLVIAKPRRVWFQRFRAWGKLFQNAVYLWGKFYVDLCEVSRFCVVGCL